MPKTKLGITVGALGALAFFTCFFGGYMASLLVAGYVLLFEENQWLKKSAVKAVLLMVAFSFAVSVVRLIPDVLGLITDLLNIIKINFSLSIINRLITFIVSCINFVEKLLFLGLGLTAMSQGTIGVPIIDPLVEKFFPTES